MNNKKSETLNNVKETTEDVLTEEERIMERWGEYSKDMSKKKNKNKKAEIKVDKSKQITRKEVSEAIRKAKAGKATGHDKVSTEMINVFTEKAVEHLKEIMNATVVQGNTPKTDLNQDKTKSMLIEKKSEQHRTELGMEQEELQLVK
ncbi:hypothetical protein ILUMI_01823 [Ignelater luminosus]|uniref:Uncharacterized protein n=1 Tax=Ignelater luminosus TaxID=2038154 RepID=A0A8K0GH28_IGNLU|nr:hypothetical protein ILUMI_01823 [Ignelater luminosus]